MVYGFDHALTINRTGGGTFSLDQIDMGLSWYTGEDTFAVTLNGLDTIMLGNTYQTYHFTDLTNVTSITLSGAPDDGYLGLDNIGFHTTDVPEPATCALLALGLLGVAAQRRSRAR